MKEDSFTLVVIGTYSFNSLKRHLSGSSQFFGSSTFTYVVLESGFNLISTSLIVSIEPLIYLSETSALSVNITLPLTQNINLAGRSVVWERPTLSDIDLKHVFVTILSLNYNNFSYAVFIFLTWQVIIQVNPYKFTKS